MKRTIVIASIAAGAVLVAAAATRSFWVAPQPAQVDAWLHLAADGRDARAEAALARWAQRGNATARRDYVALLGHRGDPASRARLIAVLRDGASAGDSRAATLLAGMIYRGEAGPGPRAVDGARVDATRTEALRLYGLGAAGGIAEATRMLGLLALDGSNDPAGSAPAAALFAQAAAQGDAPAMFLLANLLRAGQGVARDEAQALQWYQRAADADYAPAIQALALAWRYGELGLSADPSQSQLMDHEAAEALAHARPPSGADGRT